MSWQRGSHIDGAVEGKDPAKGWMDGVPLSGALDEDMFRAYGEAGQYDGGTSHV